MFEVMSSSSDGKLRSGTELNSNGELELYCALITVFEKNLEIRAYLELIFHEYRAKYEIRRDLPCIDNWVHVDIKHRDKLVILKILEKHNQLIVHQINLSLNVKNNSISIGPKEVHSPKSNSEPSFQKKGSNSIFKSLNLPVDRIYVEMLVFYLERHFSSVKLEISDKVNINFIQDFGDNCYSFCQSLQNDRETILKFIYSLGYIPILTGDRKGANMHVLKVVYELGGTWEVERLNFMRISSGSISSLGEICYALIEGGGLDEIYSSPVHIYIEESHLRRRFGEVYNSVDVYNLVLLFAEGRRIERAVVCGRVDEPPPVSGWRSRQEWNRWGSKTDIIVRSVNEAQILDVYLTFFLQIQRDISSQTCSNICIYLDNNFFAPNNNTSATKQLKEVFQAARINKVSLTIWLWEERPLALEKEFLKEEQCFDVHYLNNIAKYILF